MSDDKDDVHELAGGWITERRNTPIPAFLKLAYVGFSAFGVIYLVAYAAGEVAHATRGPLVQQLNAVTGAPGTAFLGALVAILAAFGAGLGWYAVVRRPAEGE